AARAALVVAGADGRGDARAAARLGQGRAAETTAIFVEPAFRLVGRREPPERLLVRPFADAGGEEPRRTGDRAALPDLDLGVGEARQGLAELLERGAAGAGRGEAGGQARTGADLDQCDRARDPRPRAGARPLARPRRARDALVILLGGVGRQLEAEAAVGAAMQLHGQRLG